MLFIFLHPQCKSEKPALECLLNQNMSLFTSTNVTISSVAFKGSYSLQLIFKEPKQQRSHIYSTHHFKLDTEVGI